VILLALHSLSALAMGVFVALFILHNSAGFTSTWPIALLGAIYVAAYVLASPGLALCRRFRLPTAMVRAVYLLIIIVLPWTFARGTLVDYYQPLSLFDDAIIALAVSWVLLMAAAVLALWRMDSRLLLVALIALAGPLCAQSLYWINNPEPAQQLALHRDIFVGGDGAYDTYRIPALLVLPAGSVMASGERLNADRLLAMAEARQDTALDTGRIDLVQRYSDDGGLTWSTQTVICSHRIGKNRGKCGNATPAFDAQRGVVWLAYNLSGIPGDLPEGPRPHSSHVMHSDDGGMNWIEPRELPFNNLVFGPGHGIQKQLAPAVGRLVIPGNRKGYSSVIYSDDGGDTWLQGVEQITGNENEIAELSDGSLYMATRHMAPIGRPPEPNGRLYAHSADGGQSWGEVALAQEIPTPICQASVVSDVAGGLWFSNPAHKKARVQMTVRASNNDGASWSKALLVYPGPAGYSQLALLSDGRLGLLYERGRMAYSEMISFAAVEAGQLTPF
jgi:sialidase-1